MSIKLTDLGISKFITHKKGTKSVIISNSGTPKYMAPEQFSKQKIDGVKVEIFNLGMVLFHLCFRAFPFEGNAFKDLKSRDPDFVAKFVESPKNE